MFLNSIVVFLIVLFKFLLATKILSSSSFVIYMLIILVVVLGCCKILSFEKIKKYALMRMLFILMFGFFSLIKSSTVNYIFPLILAIVYYDKNNNLDYKIKHLIKSFFFSTLICFLITVLLNYLSIIPSYNLVRYKSDGLVIRHSLGFEHPAFVGLYFTFMLFAFLYLYGEKKISMFISLILSFLIYYISDSRISLLVCLLYICLFYFRKNKFVVKWLNKLTSNLFVILTIFTILSTFLYTKYNLTILDAFFSGRLTIYHNVINGLNILKSPLGLSIDNIVLDNFYLSIFYYFGFIGYFIVWLFYYCSTKKISSDIKLLIIQFCLLIYGLADTNIIVSNINFMISIQMIYLITSNKKGL